MDAQIPSSSGDDRANAQASVSEGASSRESRDFIADSAHLVVRGRNADVYLMNDTQVLRRLHTGALTYPNVDILLHLNALGFPTARVIEADGTDLVMERLHGPNLLQALDAGEVTLAEGVRILLDLHAALHALPVPQHHQDTLNPAETAGAVSTGRASRGAPGGLGAPTSVTASRHGPSMVHLDLHPGTILLTATGPQLVDWESAQLGSGDLDLATTALVFAEVVADGNEYALAAHRMLRHFAREAGPTFGRHLTEAASIRGSQTNVDPVERDLLPEATVIVQRELRRLVRQ